MTAPHAFHMRVTSKDLTGYYYPNWDRAVPIVVHAANQQEAYQKCWAVMGDNPRGRGWTWTAKIDSVREVSQQ